MKLLKVGESGLHSRINRRGIIEQNLFIERAKARTRKTKGREKQQTRNAMKRRKIRSRGSDSVWKEINRLLK